MLARDWLAAADCALGARLRSCFRVHAWNEKAEVRRNEKSTFDRDAGCNDFSVDPWAPTPDTSTVPDRGYERYLRFLRRLYCRTSSTTRSGRSIATRSPGPTRRGNRIDLEPVG